MIRWLGRLLVAVCVGGALVPVPNGARPVSAASATIDCAPQPSGGAAVTAPLESYTAINPVRLVDTRNNVGGVGVPIEAGCTMRLDISADVPAAAAAVALSMTAVSDEADFFTVYPCAAGRPATSNLNSRAGVPTPNLVVAIPDASRKICIFSHGRSHLIVDLSGWWSDGPDRFASIEPERVYDSRRPGNLPLRPFRVREVIIPSTTIDADARVAVVNLTTTRSAQAGFIVAFPCGQPAPLASNLNFVAGEDRAVGAIVGLGLGRTLCLLSDVSTDVIVDVTGYYGPPPTFGPTAALVPDAGRRVVDSRNGIGGPQAPFAAGEIRSFDPVAGRPDANAASAVTLNFISTRSTGDGFLTVFPCGAPAPEVSSLNFRAGQEATNLTTVKLGADRRVCVLASAPTDVVVDVFGVMNAPTGSPFERLSFDKPVWPAFDPAATDYAVECGAGSGTSSVTVGLRLLPLTTATISVAGGPPAPVATGSTTVTMRTDEPLVIRTDQQGTVRNLHLRCTPTDFPRLAVNRPGAPTPGWYVTTSGFSSTNPSRNGPYLMILDRFGAPVWYKRTPAPVIDLKLLSDGRLAFTPTLGPFGIDPDQGYWLTPLQGTPTQKHQTVGGLLTDHHDYIELPGGGRALVSYPIRTDGTLPFGAPADTYSDGVIQEIDAAGVEIWRWEMHEHFDPASSTFPVNFESTPGFAGTGWDVFHINAIDRQPDGDYVVTVRHMDGVFRVDRPTGNVLWTLGTPATRDPQPTGPVAPRLTVVNDPFGGPKRPHDARLTGNVLTMLDNRAGTGQPSRAVGYAIDEAAGTATLLWEFRNSTLGGPTLGSTQQTDDSVVVNWGSGLQPVLEELALDGSLLMSVGLPNGGNSYRTIKYPVASFDVNVLRATAGGSVSSPP